MAKDLLRVVEKNSSVVVAEFEPELEIRDAHYFVGHKK